MELLNLYGYLSVLWRALTLAFQSLTVGGVIFCSYVVSPLSASDQSSSMDGLRALRTLMVTAAIGLMFAQALAIGTTAILLEQTLGLNLRQLVGATFFLAGSLVIAGAWGVAISNWKPPCRSVFLSSAFWGAILAGSLFTSHALDRVQERAVPAVATILHQAATAAWIGGLPYFLLVVSRSKSTSFIELAGRRFSRLAVTSVTLLISAGLVLAICYIGSPPALYGTSYGVMTISKLVLLVGLLALGGVC